MNKDIESKLQEIKEELLKNESVKEFISLKKKVEENEYLSKLVLEIKEIQKKLVDLKSKCQYDEFDKLKALYDIKLEELQNNPLYTNYLYYKDEVESIYKEIESILKGL